MSSVEIKRGQTLTKILITGATGFIGGALARRWTAAGLQQDGDADMRAFVRNPHSCRAQELAGLGIQLAPGDLTNPASFGPACHGIDVIVHAADTCLDDWRQAWAVNVEATRQLYLAAMAVGARRFIFISSLAVYGGLDDEMNEEFKPAPYGDLYADTKIAAEQALLQQAEQNGGHHPELTILRLPAVYGPGSPRWTDTPLMEARRNRLIIPGNGQMSFFYLYVANMIDALTAAVLSPHTGLYNIWDGSTTYSQFMQYYCDMVGAKPKFMPAATLMMMAVMGELYGKIRGKDVPLSRRTVKRMLKAQTEPMRQPEKVKGELKWQPRFTLPDGMALIQKEYAAIGKFAP